MSIFFHDLMEQKSMLLNENDSGRTINVRTGDNLTIRLKENPTTGFQWAVGFAEGMELVMDRFDAGQGMGATGIREFQFRATQAGSYQILLKHWRAWEGETSVIARFVATINVE